MLNFFYSLSLQKKILVINLFILTLFFSITGFAIYNLFQLNGHLSNIGGTLLPAAQYINKLNSEANGLRIKHYKYIYLKDETKKQKVVNEEIPPFVEDIDAYEKEYAKYIKTPEQQQDFEEYKKLFSTYLKAVDGAISLDRAGKIEEAQTLISSKTAKQFQAVRKQLEKVSEKYTKASEQARQQSISQFQNSLSMILIASAATFIIVVLLGLWLSKIISNPIQHVTNIAQSIAAGNLKKDADGQVTKSQVSELSHALHKMVGNLRELVDQIKNNASDVASASASLTEASAQMKISAQTVDELSSSAVQVTESLNDGAKVVALAAGESSSGGILMLCGRG
jgi:methyl-accepting chemotaxis protein